MRPLCKLPATTLLLAACAHTAPSISFPPSSPPDQVLTLMAARRPYRFKMVHQVAAHFQGQTHVMVGYLLGKKDGDFRVSASAAMGPRLFDVVKVGGRVDARTHLKQIEGRLDPKYVARAIELAYFADCPAGAPLVSEDGPLDRYRCPVAPQDSDVDLMEETIDSRTLSPASKVFSRGGQTQVTIRYDDVRPHGEIWLASKIHQELVAGPSIDIALVEYHAPADFGEEALVLPAPAPTIH
jgi:hypothetical protein